MSQEDFQTRPPENVPGRFYVSEYCMICSACRAIAPTIFEINEEKLYSFVKKQPEGEAEEAQAREAMEACCVEAIHDDGLEFREKMPGPPSASPPKTSWWRRILK